MSSLKKKEFILKFKNIEQMLIMERFLLNTPVEIENNNLYNLIIGIINQIANKVSIRIDKGNIRGKLSFKDYEFNVLMFLLDKLIESKPDMTNPDNVHLRQVYDKVAKYAIVLHRQFDNNLNVNLNVKHNVKMIN